MARARRVPGARGPRGVAAGAVLAITVAACGGGCRDAKPSKAAYFRSIDRFCAGVADAAQQVSKDTDAVRADKKATQKQVVTVVSASLLQFADATESALGDLRKVAVPDEFAPFQRATDKGYRAFVATLRSTAGAARKDGTKALRRFGPKLKAIKLPDTPPDVAANAKRCASFTPKG